MKKKSTSIRTQLITVLCLSILFCVSIVLVSTISTQDVLRGTQTFFGCNRALTDFYSNVAEMDSVARDWLYSNRDEEYQQYLRLVDAAREDLSRIQSTGDAELIWRTELLSNMLQHYQDGLDKFQPDSTSITHTYEIYNDLSYRCRLIRGTATSYYVYLADYLQSRSDNAQALWNHRRIIQIVLLSILLLDIIFVSIFCSRSILRPIRIMEQNAHRIKSGDFRLEPVSKASSELAAMSDALSEMAVQVEKNIHIMQENARLEQQLLREESERLSMQNLVTQAELRSLQAQINPHFLFNTLSMISKSAYLSNDTMTSELIDRLAEFLRYALDKSSTTSTLREEITSMENYLFIQKCRFAGRLDFIVDIPQDIPNLKMPAIILQPLVENAIKHGITALSDETTISLKIRQRNHHIRIQIEDNGVGMSAERLEELQTCLKLGLESSSGRPGSSIGLTNVYRRLMIYFGADMQFTIESEEGCGTLITISLPEEVTL